ncbi:hemolysin family protein [Thermodesulfatator atlanticus]|uniref:hemolysin family protein n=1 Tax=Thermodesulfatator atlanticus TaxID=501497 RepID=UPI0003B72D4C|nr:hemolysin family protein [Thermodesulfatator atlanticus]
MIYLSGVLTFLVLLFCEAFFAGAEIALVSAEENQLKRLAQKSFGARLALKLLANPERLLTTTLLGLNLSVIGNSVLTTSFLIEVIPRYGGLVAVLMLPPLMLFFGQMIPKSIAQQKAASLAPKVAPLVYSISFVFCPLVWLVSGLIFLFTKEETKRLPSITKEEIRVLVCSEEGLDPHERRLIARLIDFSKKKASQVMIPLVWVKAIEESKDLKEALVLFAETGFSRLLVYREHLHDMVGLLLALDLLDARDLSQPVRLFMREVKYVPEFKSASELLAEMQNQGQTLVVVVNEYGQAVGIVTIEDLVEEVLGEFWDEFDQKLVPYVKLSENHFLVKAWLEIEQANEELGLNIPPGDYETIGGFVLKLAGRIPKVGEVFEYGNLKIQVRRATKTTIDELEIWIKPDLPDSRS